MILASLQYKRVCMKRTREHCWQELLHPSSAEHGASNAAAVSIDSTNAGVNGGHRGAAHHRNRSLRDVDEGAITFVDWREHTVEDREYVYPWRGG